MIHKPHSLLISDSLLGTIAGGIIGFGSSMGTTFLQRWITRPRISIDEQTTEVRMNYAQEDSADNVPGWDEFIATRIKVENNGMTAAENCKAYLMIGNNAHRVAWMLPKDDFSVTINAHDSEYVDLCAISEYSNNEGQRRRFLTTERGYGKSQQHGRAMELGIMPAVLKISSSNAKGSVKKIWISDTPNEHSKIVHFKQV